PSSILLLCWWHVLHAWQKHFVITQWPELWTLLKQWVRMMTEAEFSEIWEKIKSPGFAPPSMVEYIAKTWLPVKEMWSNIYRPHCSVYSQGNTNMLVEAGWDGINREFQKRREIQARAKSIAKHSITPCDDADGSMFQVASQSKPNTWYQVDLEVYSCECLSFSGIDFCKHICAVQYHFPEVYETASQLAVSATAVIAPQIIPSKSQSESDAEPQADIGEYLVSELIHKLQALKLAAKKPSTLKAMPMMSTLSENLTAVLEELSVPSGILPARRKVSPNEGFGWNKTAPQSKYPDPHSGKAASGTLAKADAKKGPLGTSYVVSWSNLLTD
ncbi:hypothetical protein C8J56DRAFT_792767, partial [Mycena floridula]